MSAPWKWRPFICINCGARMRGDALSCPSCGMRYEYDEQDARSQAAEDAEAQGDLFATMETGGQHGGAMTDRELAALGVATESGLTGGNT